MIKQNEKIRPVEALSQGRWHSLSSWLRNLLYGLVLGLCGVLIATSCKTIYLPSSSSTETHIKDSTVWNIKDSIRIIERSRYKDYGGLLDTLRVKGNRSSSKSWVDTTRNVLNTELVEEPIEEKTRIVYKDRIQYRDSIQYVEKPIEIPIETEVKVYPRWMIILSLLGIASTLVLGFQVYLKIKKKRMC